MVDKQKQKQTPQDVCGEANACAAKRTVSYTTIWIDKVEADYTKAAVQ